MSPKYKLFVIYANSVLYTSGNQPQNITKLSLFNDFYEEDYEYVDFQFNGGFDYQGDHGDFN